MIRSIWLLVGDSQKYQKIILIPFKSNSAPVFFNLYPSRGSLMGGHILLYQQPTLYSYSYLPRTHNRELQEAFTLGCRHCQLRGFTKINGEGEESLKVLFH